MALEPIISASLLFLFFSLAKCNGVHWLTTRDYDLLLQTSEQVVILRRDGFVMAVIFGHTILLVYMVEFVPPPVLFPLVGSLVSGLAQCP